MDNELVPLDIQIALNYAQYLEFPFFIKKKGGETIKIEFDRNSISSRLKSYKEKGLKNIYLNEGDYQKLFEILQSELKDQKEDKIIHTEMSQLHSQAFHSMRELGVSRITLNSAKSINNIVQKQISKAGSLKTLMNSFIHNCSDEYYRYILISYLGNALIKEFEWQTDNILEKFSFASFLCDLTLKKEDYDTLRGSSTNSLPDKIKNHPLDCVNMLSPYEKIISKEILLIIETHHELPNGEGYPKALTHTAIPMLPAIFIVCQFFCETFQDQDYDEGSTEMLLSACFSRFTKGKFRQIVINLYKVFDSPFPHGGSEESKAS